MEATRARYWVMWHQTYDRSAWSSMEDLVQKTRTEEGKIYLSKIPYFDLELGYVVRN